MMVDLFRFTKSGTFNRRRRQLSSAFAAVLAMFPGFVFPFILPLFLVKSDADTYLVAFGISLTLWNVVVNNLELNTVSEVGILVSRDPRGILDRGVLRNYLRRSLSFASKVSLAFGIGLVAFYCVIRSDFRALLVAGLIAVLIPLIGSVSSVYSGLLIATGRSGIAVGSQGLRGLFGVLFIIPSISLGVWAISAGMVIGEILRTLILARASRISIGRSDNSELLSVSGLAWQSSATAVAQSSPLIDRVFLGFGSSGSIVAYEIADKLLFSVVQFLNLSILIRIVGQWSRIGQYSLQEARDSVRRGLWLIVGSSTILGFLVIAVLVFVSRSEYVPAEWSEGVRWGIVLVGSLPLVMLNSTYGRLLILLGKQRLLIRFAILSVACNLIFDAVFFAIFGTVGIIFATVVVRLVNAVCYIVYFNRRGWLALKSKVASESRG